MPSPPLKVSAPPARRGRPRAGRPRCRPGCRRCRRRRAASPCPRRREEVGETGAVEDVVAGAAVECGRDHAHAVEPVLAAEAARLVAGERHRRALDVAELQRARGRGRPGRARWERAEDQRRARRVPAERLVGVRPGVDQRGPFLRERPGVRGRGHDQADAAAAGRAASARPRLPLAGRGARGLAARHRQRLHAEAHELGQVLALGDPHGHDRARAQARAAERAADAERAARCGSP